MLLILQKPQGRLPQGFPLFCNRLTPPPPAACPCCDTTLHKLCRCLLCVAALQAWERSRERACRHPHPPPAPLPIYSYSHSHTHVLAAHTFSTCPNPGEGNLRAVCDVTSCTQPVNSLSSLNVSKYRGCINSSSKKKKKGREGSASFYCVFPPSSFFFV